MKEVTKSQPQQFIDLVLQGTQCLYEAGVIAAQAIDADPDFIDKVCDLCPDMTAEFVKRMELIGRKRLHPQLAISETPGVRRLRRLPYGLQEKHVKTPLPVLVRTESGWDVLKIDVRNLTPAQSVQVMADDHIRSEAEQRAFLEDRAAVNAVPKGHNPPYRVTGNRLVIIEPCQLSRKELATLLAEME